MRKILLLIVFLIPLQKRFHKPFRDFANALYDPSWNLPALFEKNIGFFAVDIPLMLLFFFTLKRVPWRDLFFQGEKKFLTAFLLAAVVSIVLSVHPAYALYYFRWLHLLLPAGLFYFLSSTPVERRTLFFTILFASLLQSLIACAQYFLQDSIGLKLLGEACLHSKHQTGASFFSANGSLWLFGPEKEGRFLIRAYGTLPHPNILGGFLTMGLIVTCSLFQESRRKFFFAAALAIQVFALALTFSRAALFFFVGAAFLLILLAYRRKEKVAALSWTLVASLAVSVALLFSQIVHRGGVFNYNAAAQASDQGRIAYQKVAAAMIRDHPVFGVGFYNFFLFVGEYVKEGALSIVHNIYLLIAAETGLVGLALFAAFIGAVVWKGWQGRDDPKTAAMLCLCIAFAAIGFCDFYLIFHQQGRLMLFLAAGLTVMPQPNSKVVIVKVE